MNPIWICQLPSLAMGPQRELGRNAEPKLTSVHYDIVAQDHDTLFAELGAVRQHKGSTSLFHGYSSMSQNGRSVAPMCLAPYTIMCVSVIIICVLVHGQTRPHVRLVSCRDYQLYTFHDASQSMYCSYFNIYIIYTDLSPSPAMCLPCTDTPEFSHDATLQDSSLAVGPAADGSCIL